MFRFSDLVLLVVIVSVGFLTYKASNQEVSVNGYEYIKEHYSQNCLQNILGTTNTREKVSVRQFNAYQHCYVNDRRVQRNKEMAERKDDLKKEILGNL